MAAAAVRLCWDHAREGAFRFERGLAGAIRVLVLGEESEGGGGRPSEAYIPVILIPEFFSL